MGVALIELLGEPIRVPAGVPLIRALQYLELELGRVRCDWSRFCFNDEADCCRCEVQLPGCPPVQGRACAIMVRDGLSVRTLPPGARLTPLAPGEPL